MRTLFIKIFFLIATTLLFVACASTHKPIMLTAYHYSTPQELNDSIAVSYNTNVQRISDNGWYAKKEDKRGMVAIGVKVVNYSSQPIVLTKENFGVYGRDSRKPVLTSLEYSQKIKQRVGIHLLHALYGPWAITWDTDPQGHSTDVHFIYIPIGALIGIGNAIRASRANQNNAADINRLQIWNKTIPARGELTGIILLRGFPDESLSFRLE
jgi:hypothetical protein